jgi:hypothetical protein
LQTSFTIGKNGKQMGKLTQITLLRFKKLCNFAFRCCFREMHCTQIREHAGEEAEGAQGVQYGVLVQLARYIHATPFSYAMQLQMACWCNWLDIFTPLLSPAHESTSPALTPYFLQIDRLKLHRK